MREPLRGLGRDGGDVSACGCREAMCSHVSILGDAPPDLPGLAPAEIERLALLAEEAGEVVQAIGKILRHGYESVNPLHPGPTNRGALEKEIGDFLAAVHLMAERSDVDRRLVELARTEKLAKVGCWLHHQRPK